MLTRHRKEKLMDHLRSTGQIIAKDLSAAMGVSEDTIRRDLRELAAKGQLQRVHGGALPASEAMGDFATRLHVATAEKVAIGRSAAAMVQDGQVVVLDGGTTAVQIARHLAPGLRATVVTHSPSVALELVEHPTVEVIVIGGRLFKHSVVSVGAAAVEAIQRVRADVYFMGVTGIHLTAGLTTGDFEEAHVKRALSAVSAETIVLGSPEKLQAASPYLVTSVAEVNGLIVASSTPEEVIAPFRLAGLQVTRALGAG